MSKLDELIRRVSGEKMKTIKIAAWGDIHVHPTNEFSRPTDDGRTTLIHHFESVAQAFVIPAIMGLRPDAAIFLGDVFLPFGSVDTLSLQCADRLFRQYDNVLSDVRYSIDRISILGNHDFYSVKHAIYTPNFLPGLRVAPGFVDISDARVGLIPYLDAEGLRTGEAVLRKILEGDDCSLIFSHLDIEGLTYTTERASKGIDLSQFHPKRPKVIVNGHYHRAQVLTVGDFTVICPGAITSRDFKDAATQDSGDVRGMVLIEGGDGDWSWSRIANSVAHQYRIVRDSSPEDFAKELRSLSGTGRKFCFYRIVCSAADRPAFEAVVNEADLGGVSWAPSEAVKVSGRSEIASAKTPEDVVRIWVEKSPGDGLDSGLLVEAGIGILREASSSYKPVAALPRNVRILGVEIENFMGINEAKAEFGGAGLTLIEGVNLGDSKMPSNGAGKSSFAEGLYWTLTGEMIRRGKKEDVTSDRCAFTSGRVKLDVDGVPYEIFRSVDHPQHGTTVLLYRGGENISARNPYRGENTTQQKVLNLIGDPSLVRQVVVLSHGIPGAGRFSELSDPERKRVLGVLCNLGLYEAAVEKAREEVAELSLKTGTLSKSIEQGSARVKELKDEADRLLSDIEGERKKIGENKLALDERPAAGIDVPALESDLAGLRSKASEHEKSIDRLLQTRKNAAARESSLRESVKPFDESVQDLNSKLSSKRTLLRDAEKISISGVCPICGSGHDKGKHTEHASKLRDEISGLEEELLGPSGKAEEIVLEIDKWVEIRGKVDKDVESIRKKSAGLAVDISSLERRIESAKSAERDRKAEIDRLISASEARIGAWEERHSKVLSELDTLSSKLRDDGAELEGASSREKLVRYWVGAFQARAIPSFVLDQVIDELNIVMVKYSGILFGDRQVSVTSDSGRGRENTLDVFLDKRLLDLCSSGMKRRVDLTVQFALHDMAISRQGDMGILFCDEIDAFLDDFSGVIECLEDKAKVTKVLLVSQDPRFHSMITDRWRVVREDDRSVLIVHPD